MKLDNGRIPLCFNHDTGPYACTLTRGHRGPHEAWTAFKLVRSWPNRDGGAHLRVITDDSTAPTRTDPTGER